MSEEIEATELANELVMEQADKDGSPSPERHWHRLVAFSTLIFAMLAALGGLLSGITAHESTLEKTQEVISLTVLEGDRVSVEVLKAKHDILTSLGQSPDEAEIEAIRAFEMEIEEKQAEFAQEERLVQSIGQTHLIFAISVTFIAVAISLSGMSVVLGQKWLWALGMVPGLVGAVGLVLGIITMLD
jgi:uncharacterized Tic20 family protein